MLLLPKWSLTPTLPSVRDFESSTAIEMVAKLYNAMNGLISEYNEFADQINKEISDFVGSSETEIANFKEYIEKRLCCKFEDMDAAYAKMKADITVYADTKIDETYEKYLGGYVSQIVSEKIANGDVDITLVYDPETESLNMTTGEG